VDGSVTVVVPRRARASGYDDFVLQHADWVRKQQARFAALREPAGEGALSPTTAVQYRGRTIPLQIIPAEGSRMAMRYDGDQFLVHRPEHATDDHLKDLFRSWFRQVARPLFEERVSTLNARTRYQWQRIRIGEQKTKWGSCSSRGTLSFNWRLLMAPPEVLDYVVIHELAHLKQPNHSPAFWALVEQQCPDHKDHRRWLNKHGVSLAL
jgi:predicted metal-dependent hydrolase